MRSDYLIIGYDSRKVRKCSLQAFFPFLSVFKVRSLQDVKSLSTQSRILTTLRKKAFENIVGKGENAGNQHFLLCPTMFSTLSEREIIISAIFIMLSANAFNVDKSKILSFGKTV